MTIALNPGSFDPVTNGHIDIAARAATLFEKVIIGVYDLPAKRLLFDRDERAGMMREAVAKFPNIEVRLYSGLTVDYARKIGARVIVRGLRANSDFEAEFAMALMNKKNEPDIETVCLMTSNEYVFLSSSLLKEVAALGGEIRNLVPPHVAEALRRKYEAQGVKS